MTFSDLMLLLILFVLWNIDSNIVNYINQKKKNDN